MVLGRTLNLIRRPLQSVERVRLQLDHSSKPASKPGMPGQASKPPGIDSRGIQAWRKASIGARENLLIRGQGRSRREQGGAGPHNILSPGAANPSNIYDLGHFAANHVPRVTWHVQTTTQQAIQPRPSPGILPPTCQQALRTPNHPNIPSSIPRI